MDTDELWQQLQATDSHLDGTEKEADGQKRRLNVLSQELGELNRTVSYLNSQLQRMTNASFNSKKRGGGAVSGQKKDLGTGHGTTSEMYLFCAGRVFPKHPGILPGVTAGPAASEQLRPRPSEPGGSVQAHAPGHR